MTFQLILQMVFGSAEPLESYCAHLLLSKDEIYFSILETKGSRSLYGPRPTLQVHLRFFFNTSTHIHACMHRLEEGKFFQIMNRNIRLQ